MNQVFGSRNCKVSKKGDEEKASREMASDTRSKLISISVDIVHHFLLLFRAARLMLELAGRIVGLERDFPRRALGIILTRLISRSSYEAERKRPGFSPCQVYNQRFSSGNHSRERERERLMPAHEFAMFCGMPGHRTPFVRVSAKSTSSKMQYDLSYVPNNAVTVAATFSSASLA